MVNPKGLGRYFKTNENRKGVKIMMFMTMVKGLGFGMVALKGSASIYRMIKGQLKEGVEDLKWVLVALMVLGVIPMVIEMIWV